MADRFAARAGSAAPVGAVATSDPNALTVLRTRGPRLTKFVRRDGTVEPYGQALWYEARPTFVGTDEALASVLRRLECSPRQAIVTGAIAPGADPARMRRLGRPDPDTGAEATLLDVPRAVIPLDLDRVAAPPELDPRDLHGCADRARRALPPAFHNASCVAAATSGHCLKPGLRFRLWFRFDRPLTCAELKFWLQREGAPVDLGPLHAAGIAYTAAPIFEDPSNDPLPNGRTVVLPGTPTVATPPPNELTPPTPAPRAASCPLPQDDDGEWNYAAASINLIPNNNEGVPYDLWLRVGMALHSTGDERARELWDDWAARSSKFNARKQHDAWRSFNAARTGALSVGTLFKIAEPFLEAASARLIEPQSCDLFDQWMIESGYASRAEIDEANERRQWKTTGRLVLDFGRPPAVDFKDAPRCGKVKRPVAIDHWAAFRWALLRIWKSPGDKRAVASGSLRIAEQVVRGRLDAAHMRLRIIEAAAGAGVPEEEVNRIFDWALVTALRDKEAVL